MPIDRWTLRPATELQRFAGEWDALNARCSNSALLDSAFVLAALKHFGRGDEMLACLGPEDAWSGAAVVFPKSRVSWETFQPSQAPLGAWLQPPGADMIERVDGLAATLGWGCIMVSVTQQDPDHVPRPDTTVRTETVDYIETARVAVAGDWSAYWAARGQNLRHNLRKARKKLADAGSLARLEVLDAPSDMARGVQTYGEIEARSWKAGEGTALAPGNDQGRFYADLLERFARKGEARIYRLWIDGAVAATDLCILSRGSLVILKTTFDERFRDFSPAFLMREDAFKAVFDRQECDRIEFYGRVMDWHRRWTDEIRRMYHVNVMRWHLTARLRKIRTTRMV